MNVQHSSLYPLVYQFLVDCKFKKLAKDFKVLTSTVYPEANHPTLLEVYEEWVKIRPKAYLIGKVTNLSVEKVKARKKRKSCRESSEKLTNPPTKWLKPDFSSSDDDSFTKDETNNMEAAKYHSINLEERSDDNIDDTSDVINYFGGDFVPKSTLNRDISEMDETTSIINQINQMHSIVVKVENIENESFQESKGDLSVFHQNIYSDQSIPSSFNNENDQDVSFCNEMDLSKKRTCHICNRSFAHLSALKAHLQVHTVKKRYHCDICNKSFAHLHILKTHTRIHTGERPYCCDICNKSFSQLNNLKAHSRIHTGERPYCCDICNKSFTHLNTLRTHTRIHTGERPYYCDICNRSFTKSYTLKTHSRTHTGERPHRCDVCDKSFSQFGNLKRHLLTHTGERPYTCVICNKSFVRSYDLKNHFSTHTVI